MVQNKNKKQTQLKKVRYDYRIFALGALVSGIDGAYWFFSLYNLLFGLLLPASILSGPIAIAIPIVGSILLAGFHVIQAIRGETRRQNAEHQAQLNLEKAQKKLENVIHTIETASLDKDIVPYKKHLEAKYGPTPEQKKPTFFDKLSQVILKGASRGRLTGRTIKNTTKLLRNVLILAGIPLATILGSNPLIVVMFATFIPVMMVSSLTIRSIQSNSSKKVKARNSEANKSLKEYRYLKKQPAVYEYFLNKKLEALGQAERVSVVYQKPTQNIGDDSKKNNIGQSSKSELHAPENNVEQVVKPTQQIPLAPEQPTQPDSQDSKEQAVPIKKSPYKFHKLSRSESPSRCITPSPIGHSKQNISLGNVGKQVAEVVKAKEKSEVPQPYDKQTGEMVKPRVAIDNDERRAPASKFFMPIQSQSHCFQDVRPLMSCSSQTLVYG